MTSDPSSTSSESTAWSRDDLAESPHQTADKADRVRAMFGAIAKAYDRNNRLHSFGRDQAWRRRAVREAGIRPEDRVLDVACGTGDLSEAFARACPAEVVGVDFTPEMLEVARHKAQRRRPAGVPTPAYQAGDAMDLAFDDGRFDVVSIAFGIRNVAEPERALAEFRRVLAPGGRLIVLEFGEPPSRILRGLNRFYTHRIMPVTATLIAGDRSGAYHYLPRSVETFLEPGRLAAAIEAAGFSAVTTHSLTFGVCRLHRAVVSNDR